MAQKFSGERFLPEECNREMFIEHNQRYQFAKQVVCGKKVLDAACGEGYGSSILAEAAEKTTGLDIDRETVEAAQVKYGSEKLTYVCGSVAELPFEEDSFDALVSFETIEHIDGELQKAFLSEAKRVLKPDGVLVISTPNKAVYTDLVEGYNEFHVREFYVGEFLDCLREHFANIEVYCQYPHTGYFIAKDGVEQSAGRTGCAMEDSRYVIAVCSNAALPRVEDTDSLSVFDSSMYYFMQRNGNLLDRKILNVKDEADRFERQQEGELANQKQYIGQLEHDIEQLKLDLAKYTEESKAYIAHLEKDIAELNTGIQAKDAEIHRLKTEVHLLEETSKLGFLKKGRKRLK